MDVYRIPNPKNCFRSFLACFYVEVLSVKQEIFVEGLTEVEVLSLHDVR